MGGPLCRMSILKKILSIFFGHSHFIMVPCHHFRKYLSSYRLFFKGGGGRFKC